MTFICLIAFSTGNISMYVGEVRYVPTTADDYEDYLELKNEGYLAEYEGNLPAVSPSDIGKVLTVNASGAWVPVMPTKELPTVTSADEGEALRVDNGGMWVASAPAVHVINLTPSGGGLVTTETPNDLMAAISKHEKIVVVMQGYGQIEPVTIDTQDGVPTIFKFLYTIFEGQRLMIGRMQGSNLDAPYLISEFDIKRIVEPFTIEVYGAIDAGTGTQTFATSVTTDMVHAAMNIGQDIIVEIMGFTLKATVVNTGDLVTLPVLVDNGMAIYVVMVANLQDGYDFLVSTWAVTDIPAGT